MSDNVRLRLVQLDSRRRVSLGKFGVKPGDRFKVEVDSDGTIRLTPVVLMSRAHLATGGV